MDNLSPMLNGMMGHNGGPVMTMEALDSELAKEFAKYYDDPYGFVKFAFPWGEKELKGFIVRLSYLLPEARKKGIDAEASFEQFLLDAF